MSAFLPDIFSSSTPKWSKLNAAKKQSYFDILDAMFGPGYHQKVVIEASGAIEINSKNLKIKDQSSTYLLKKWKSNTPIEVIENSIETVKYLSNKGVQVAKPLFFNDQEFVFIYENEKWTCSHFIEGNYYSGTKGQLANIPITLAHLCDQFSAFPKKLYPSVQLEYDIGNYEQTLSKIENCKREWDNVFGYSFSHLLKQSWGEIQSALEHLKSKSIDTGIVMPMHCDLHPHNFLFEEDKLKAIIDYDSVKLVPVGIALAFSTLKLCKQAMVYSEQQNPFELGQNFKEKLIQNLRTDCLGSDDFYTLALYEVMRRLCLIFDLNINNDKRWNNILPVQLAHIIEAKHLFKLNLKA